MLGDDPNDWCEALFDRADGPERRRLLLIGGRPPGVVRLPVSEDEFEEFRIYSWADGSPVYESSGFVPR